MGALALGVGRMVSGPRSRAPSRPGATRGKPPRARAPCGQVHLHRCSGSPCGKRDQFYSMSSFHLEISLLPSNTIGITFHCQSIFFFMRLFRSTNRRLRLHRIPIFIFQCDRLSKERTWGDKASMQPKEVCLVPVALRSLSNPHPVHLMH